MQIDNFSIIGLLGGYFSGRSLLRILLFTTIASIVPCNYGYCVPMVELSPIFTHNLFSSANERIQRCKLPYQLPSFRIREMLPKNPFLSAYHLIS